MFSTHELFPITEDGSISPLDYRSSTNEKDAETPSDVPDDAMREGWRDSLAALAAQASDLRRRCAGCLRRVAADAKVVFQRLTIELENLNSLAEVYPVNFCFVFTTSPFLVSNGNK